MRYENTITVHADPLLLSVEETGRILKTGDNEIFEYFGFSFLLIVDAVGRGDGSELISFVVRDTEQYGGPDGDLLRFSRDPKHFKFANHRTLIRLPDGELLSPP